MRGTSNRPKHRYTACNMHVDGAARRCALDTGASEFHSNTMVLPRAAKGDRGMIADWLQAVNWLIWGACGSIWLWNGWKWHKIGALKEKRELQRITFEQEMNEMMRKAALDAGVKMEVKH